MGGSQKGSKWEREFCKILSLWWTQCEKPRDDIFWRTASSGGRATQRSKKKQQTFGQYGDVQATDPIGQPLIDLCSIELKRGYSKHNLSDLIDTPHGHKEPMYLSFIKQAITDCRLREDESEWILIVKRDRREAVLFTPYKFFKRLNTIVNVDGIPITKQSETGSALLRCKIFREKFCILIVTLDWFLKRVHPKDILRYHSMKRREKIDDTRRKTI